MIGMLSASSEYRSQNRMRRTDAQASQLHSLPTKKAAFAEPMECLAVSKLPEGSQWLWEIKLDGYRALAVKLGNNVTVYSRNGKPLNKKFPYIVEALQGLPDGSVVDGERVALDDSGRPVLNFLQNFTSEASRVRYFVFDLPCYKDRDLTGIPLIKREEILKSLVIRDARIKISDYIEAGATRTASSRPRAKT